jgi:hypothetical protein
MSLDPKKVIQILESVEHGKLRFFPPPPDPFKALCEEGLIFGFRVYEKVPDDLGVKIRDTGKDAFYLSLLGTEVIRLVRSGWPVQKAVELVTGERTRCRERGAGRPKE